ncbi:MAG: DUF3494 domain-containing protein [Deltaproteobacteria bacterium]|nr:DUF3494 domain-containing protein [Deltaproteobacteria bacterium]
MNVVDYRRLRVGPNVTINVDGAGNPDTVVILRVQQSFRARKFATINLVNGLQPKNLVLYARRLHGGKTMIGQHSTIAATVFAAGSLSVGEETVIDGQLFAGRSRLQARSAVVGTLVPNEIVP